MWVSPKISSSLRHLSNKVGKLLAQPKNLAKKFPISCSQFVIAFDRPPESACSCCLHLLLNTNRQRESWPDPSGAAFLACDRIVGLLEFLKELGLIGSGDARTGVPNRYGAIRSVA
jgi:hypothetical protein